jgi:hypothetical protein
MIADTIPRTIDPDTAARAAETGAAPRLFDRAVAIVLDSTCLGTSRKVATGAVDTKDADPTLIKVSKTILESKTLDAIRSLQGDTRRQVAARSTPSMMFRSSVYLLPIALLTETDEYLVSQRAKLAGLVEKFLREYAADKVKAEAKLGSMFNPTDYPAPETLAAMIGITWAYIAVDAPAKLGEVSRTIMAREQQKAAATWASALEEATAVLRAGFTDLVEHMLEKLTPGDDGKKRVFRDSMIGNVREFLRTFPSRNLGDDAELAELARDAERLLSGVDAQALREGETIRDRVTLGMTAIKARLDEAACTAPARKYSAGDE